MKTVFLSDLHIGLNAPTNWYQKTFHQQYLKAILRYIASHGEEIQDVVMLGDWFDYWVYLPEGPVPGSLSEILDANPEIFSPSADGDFITCMDSIQGELRFITGNHDLMVYAKALNQRFRALSQRGRQVVCRAIPQENMCYQSGGIYATHGHVFSLCCRADNSKSNIYKPLPIGHYISRTWSGTYQERLGQGETNAALLLNSGYPMFGVDPISWSDILMARGRKSTLAKMILYTVIVLATKGQEAPEAYFYVMQDGTKINAVQAAEQFPELSIKKNLPALMVDINRSLTREGETLCKQGHKVVVLGHTHIPKIKLILYRKYFKIEAGIYINTGFLSPSKADLDQHKSNFTFAEVERKNGKYDVRLLRVDYPHTTISKLQEISVPI